MIGVLAIVVVVTLVVLQKGFFRSTGSTEIPGAQRFDPVDIDFEILGNPLISSLRPFGFSSPVGTIPAGRSNPFVSY